MDTARQINVNSKRMLHRYAKKTILTNLHVISTYFFNTILVDEKSTWFPTTLLMQFRLMENQCNLDVL